jgi:Fe-S cluster assembly protein SufD
MTSSSKRPRPLPNLEFRGLPDMAQRSATQEQIYLAEFQSREKDGFTGDPSWAQELRKSAISRFGDLGFPIARRGNEEWKYTDVRPVAAVPFRSPAAASIPGLDSQALNSFIGDLGGDSGWSRLVFVDGIYNAGLSGLSPTLPAGVTVADLAEAMSPKSELLERHLARYADYESHAFTALNTAFLRHGALVHIPDKTLLEEPIHILFLSTGHEPDMASHPRVLVVAGKDSKAAIVESYGGLSDSRYLTNAVTEVVVGAGAKVEHYRVQRHSEEAFHVGTNDVALGRDSSFSSFTTDIGGGLVRNNLNVLMGDEGCSCVLNGVYLVTRDQHVDNQVIIDHASPYTTSRELYKGVLDGRSRSVSHGSIMVRKGAQKTDARQEDKNLLLSDRAEADTKPAFWIYADDVKCGHGASCGRLDENALFYLRSRGIDEEEARSILTHGFVNEVVDSIGNEPVRNHIDGLVSDKLRHL